MQKKKQNYTYRELQVFMLNQVIQDSDNQLVKKVYNMLEGGTGNKVKEMENGWYYIEASKIYRQSKSKSNYEIREYK